MKIKGKVYAILVIMLCMAIVLPYKINAASADTITLVGGRTFNEKLKSLATDATAVKFTKEAIPSDKIALATLIILSSYLTP